MKCGEVVFPAIDKTRPIVVVTKCTTPAATVVNVGQSHERQQQHLPGTQAVQKSIGKRKISPQTMRQNVQTLIQNDKIIKEDDGEKHQNIRK